MASPKYFNAYENLAFSRDDSGVLVELGRCKLDRGYVEEAERTLRSARALAPGDPYVLGRLFDVSTLRLDHKAAEAIVRAGQSQPVGRRMGTTAVVAVEKNGQMYVAGLGDSRAYLIRDGEVDQLTVDHSVAQSLVASGALTAEEARQSPWQHVLHKFLGCAEMNEGADVRPFTPQAGDRLAQARNPYFTNQQILANKQLRWWWNNLHYAVYDTGSGWTPQGAQTEWTPNSKSIAFSAPRRIQRAIMGPIIP